MPIAHDTSLNIGYTGIHFLTSLRVDLQLAARLNIIIYPQNHRYLLCICRIPLH